MAGRSFVQLDVELLKRLYVAEKQTTRQIAEIVGASNRTVIRRLHDAGIEMRAPGPERHEKLRDAPWLRRQYVDLAKTAQQIGDEVGASGRTVQSWLVTHQIERRAAGNVKGKMFGDEVRRAMSEAKRGKYLGDANPNWRGAKVDPNKRLRAQYATKAWSLAVRERDGHKCVDCGAVGRLHAHHIKPWKAHPELRHVVNNGKTLCPVCHQREHGRTFPAWVHHGESRTSGEHPTG